MINPDSTLTRLLREALLLGLLVMGILAARSTFADHYHVPSGSMEYTLLPGDRVFVDKRAYGLRVPFTNIDIFNGGPVRRGDVVIFDSPETGVRLIKRIVAVGGDHVVLENGQLAVNGERMASSESSDVEVFHGTSVFLNLRDGGGSPVTITVPDGELLAIGDHRGRSKDSRYFGTVSEDEIYGRAMAVYYRRGEGFRWLRL
jgi:signal peptidase I